MGKDGSEKEREREREKGGKAIVLADCSIFQGRILFHCRQIIISGFLARFPS